MRGLHLDYDVYWLAYIRSIRWNLRGPWFLREEFSWGDLHGTEPPFWHEHCRALGYPDGANPVIFIVILRLPSDLVELSERPKDFEGYPIRYESRPPARALAARVYAKARYSVGMQGPDTSGTLGGLLQHGQRGAEYVVSCAHVLGPIGGQVFSPGPARRSHWFRAKQPQHIGQVVYHRLPSPSPPRACNRTQSPSPESLDLAIAEVHAPWLSQALFPNLIRPQHLTPDAQMFAYDPVFFVGDVSGYTDAEFGHYANWQAIEIDGQERCFSDIFTITPPRPWYLNTELAREGDSGASVLRLAEGGLVSWDGMLFAGDGAHGYACFAQNVMDAVVQFDTGIELAP